MSVENIAITLTYPINCLYNISFQLPISITHTSLFILSLDGISDTQFLFSLKKNVEKKKL